MSINLIRLIPKNIKNNFLSLTALNVFTYIFPFLTYPYLINVLGIELVGVLAFSTAIINYLQIFIDYGFNLSATRETAIYNNSMNKLSEIFSSVIIIKTILFILAVVILLILVISIDIFHRYYKLYIISIGILFGNSLFPTWLFQGIEKMKFITILNLISKFFSSIAIFIFIKSKNDFLFVPIIYSFSGILILLISFLIIIFHLNIKMRIQKYETIHSYLKGGLHVFISEIFGNIYAQGSIIILGFFSSNSILGYYQIGQKIVNIIISFSQPIAKSVYPYLFTIRSENPLKLKKIFKKYILLFSYLDLTVFIILFLLSNILLEYVFHIHYNRIAIVSFKGWCIIGFITFLNVLIQPYIFALKLDKTNSKVYMLTASIFLLISIPLTYFYSYVGMLISMFVVEILIFFGSIKFINQIFSNNEFKCNY